MIKNIIVAIADNNAIGRDNSLLWHISEDLKFFKRRTSGYPVIMGRRTFESIGRPLPKRLNIVVSRKGFKAPEGVAVVPSLEIAFATAAVNMALSMSAEQEQQLFVLGGGQLYAEAMKEVDRLIVTHVHTVIEDADTFFPDINPDVWAVAGRSPLQKDEETGYDFEFVEYTRK